MPVNNAIGLGCRLNIASGRKRVYILITVVEKRQELENHEMKCSKYFWRVACCSKSTI